MRCTASGAGTFGQRTRGSVKSESDDISVMCRCGRQLESRSACNRAHVGGSRALTSLVEVFILPWKDFLLHFHPHNC